MGTTTAVPLAEIMRLVRAQGEAGLAQLGAQAFLVEVPVQAPSGFYADEAPSTRAGTVEYDPSMLLELSRSPASQVQVWPVTAGATVGRSSSNAISLDDESLSKAHARFVRSGTGWSLEELGSTNGSFVGRNPIPLLEACPLQSPVEVQFGGRRFTFMIAEDLAALFSPLEDNDPIPVARLKNELETLGSRRFLLRFQGQFLLLAYKKSKQRRMDGEFRPDAAFPLLGDQPLRVGRTSEAEIVLRDRSVSKWHGKLTRLGDTWSLEDTGSSNGSWVNGRQLAPGVPTRLNNWDSVRIGKTVFGLCLNARALLEHLMDS